MNSLNPFRAQHNTHKVVEVLTLAVKYLSGSDLAHCALVCRKIYAAVCLIQWCHPRFDDGHFHDSLHLLCRFFRLLPALSPQARHTIVEIDISNVEESLYDRVPVSFFQTLIEWCPQLRILSVARCAFFETASLRYLPKHWSLPCLQALDLSFCENVTDDMLVTLAAGLPQLQRLRLDSTRAGRAGVAALADRCNHLESISMVNTHIGDDCLAALAKFRTIHLKEVDLSRCSSISPHGLEAMTKYNVHLQYLGLAHTPIKSEPLTRLLSRKSSISTIRFLDISGCDQLATVGMANALVNSKLVILVVSTPMALACTRLQHEQPIPGLFQNTTITSMVVHDLPEGTPMSLLQNLIDILPNLTHLTFTRDYYEDDFVYGGYTQPSHPRTTITEPNIHTFNLQHQRALVSLINKRETVPGLGMRFW